MNSLYIRAYIKLLYALYLDFLCAESGSKQEEHSLDIYNFFIGRLADYTSWSEARKIAEHMAYLAGRTLWKHYREMKSLNWNINVKACFES